LLFGAVALMVALASPVSAVAAGMSTSVVNIDGQNYYVHTVVAGETLFSLTKLYGVSESDIVSNNPYAVDGLKAGQVLKIPQVKSGKTLSPRKQARLFEQHTVNQGETAYSICKRYGITIENLIEDNPGLDPTQLSIGQQLNIRKAAMNTVAPEAVDQNFQQYSAALNSVSPDFVYHTVEKGETIYSLTRLYGVTEQDIRDNNDISDGLKAGQMLKLPVHPGAEGSAAPTTPPPVPAGENGVVEAPSEPAVPAVSNGPEVPAIDSVRRPRQPNHIDIALLLPIKGADGVSANFMDFYKGALIALADLRAKGISGQVRVCNDTRSETEVRSCLERSDMQAVDLIIGPVYESELQPVLDFAREKMVPVVSPLATIDDHQSNLLWQMSPAPEMKYEKLRAVLQGDKNVVVVRSEVNDTEFEKGILPLLPAGHATINYRRKMAASEIENNLSGEKENVFVILTQDATEIDEIMARLSSIQANLVARGIRNPVVTVVGASRWQRFTGADRNLYFKLRLTFVSPYYAERSDQRIIDFDRRYIDAFGTLPSLYSYRGFDAVKLFGGAGAGDITGDLARTVNGTGAGLLQMPYHFVQSSPNGTHVNEAWGLVEYHDDYTITVK